MIDQTLYNRLVPVSRREQLMRSCTALASVWFCAAIVAVTLVWLRVNHGWFSWIALGVLAGITLIASLVAIAIAVRGAENFRSTANRIENAYPELDSALVTALEQHSPTVHGTLSYLQSEVVRRAVYHGYQHAWSRAVPQWQVVGAPLASFAALVLLMGSMIGVLIAKPIDPMRGAIAFDDVVVKDAKLALVIEPGNAEVEQGKSLLVTARFEGGMPATCVLVQQSPSGEQIEISMKQSLADPVFGGRLTNVVEPLEYFIRFDSHESERFRVSVFQYPELKRFDAQLRYPEFTEMEDNLIQDVRRLSAVKGTRVNLQAYVNKPLASAELIDPDGVKLQMTPDANDPLLYRMVLDVTHSIKYKLLLTDEQDRENRFLPTFSIKALASTAPEIDMKKPLADVEVSPLEELQLAASFWDDFGIQRAGLNYSVGGEPPTDVVLLDAIAGKTRTDAQYLIAMEELNVKPDQLVTFHFWAEDLGDDGQLRRTSSDMFFAEVRKFDEIFRQGQSPSGGQPQQQQGGQNAQQAMQLADLQKQIINATWRIIRRETLEQVSSDFTDDVEVIAQSQSEAIAQLQSLAGQVQDPDSLQFVAEAQSNMESAVSFLQQAASDSQSQWLGNALTDEKNAYQALLKLRANEHQVTRAQQQAGGGNPNSRANRQMQQLELDNQRNRYEDEQRATPPESNEQRENRQILSRLRELARRQNDLNKRIKELQSALNEAETKQEKDEIQQELKRLQEEQQQILRDTEELQERMEQTENQSKMSEQAQQLEQARENVRRSAQALEDQEISRAAAAGTRAERELTDLRDEFQKRTSGQFNEEMRQMRNEAREIEKNQNEIAQQLEGLDRQPDQARSLSEPATNDELLQQLDQQDSRIENLRQSMRETIEKAEEFQPLLAQQLYDTYRESQQQSPQDALQSTRESLNRGFVNDAKREERQARRGIEKLREGIERAAESVLGNETDALRRANQELQRLTEEVNREMQRANPDRDRNQDEPGDSPPELDERQTEPLDQPGEGQAAGQQPDSDPKDPGQGQASSNPQEQPESQRQAGQSGGQQDDSSENRPDSNPARGQQGGEGRDDRRQRSGQAGRDPRRPQSLEDSQDDPAQPPSSRSRDAWGGDQGAPRPGDPVDFDDFGGRPIPQRAPRPIEGKDYLDWSDRMRDVEEMIQDADLRSEASRIRDNAKAIRKEVKRHSKPPNWNLVNLKVVQPLVELQKKVTEELLRRTSNKSLIPIDRDPVPAEFENAVQKYYEQLGRGQ